MNKTYKNKCFQCDGNADWSLFTQFTGEHFYCDKHAREDQDWGINDSHKFWERISPDNLNKEKEMQWTNEELSIIAEQKYDLHLRSLQQAFIMGVDFTLGKLEEEEITNKQDSFEDYGGRIVNDGGIHYVVHVDSSVLGKVKTFYSNKEDADGAIESNKLAQDLLEAIGLGEVVQIKSGAHIVVGEGSLDGGSFSVMDDGSILDQEDAIKEATNSVQKFLSKL